MIMKNCYLCNANAEHERVNLNSNNLIDCHRCGKYVLTEEVIEFNLLINEPAINEKRYVLSSATRRASDSKKPLTITTDNIQELIDSVRIPQTPMEVLDKLLLLIHERLPMPPSFNTACILSEFDSPLFFCHEIFSRNGFLFGPA